MIVLRFSHRKGLAPKKFGPIFDRPLAIEILFRIVLHLG